MGCNGCRNQPAHDLSAYMYDVARKDNMETIYERFAKQQPQCGFGTNGICCTLCTDGPCQITRKAQRGVCGASADLIVARNLLFKCAQGTAANVYHARNVARTLQAVGEGKADFKIRDPEKLTSVAGNGLQARIALRRTEVLNGTPIISTFLELRNVSAIGNPMKLAWNTAKGERRVVDAQGREFAPFNESYDGMSVALNELVLPYHGTLSFDVSKRGCGIPLNKAGLIDLGPTRSWVFDHDGKDYYLQVILEIPEHKPSRDDTGRYWHGRIEIPRVLVPLKPEPIDPARIGLLIEELGRKMLDKSNSDVSEQAARELSLIDDERVIPWYLKAMDTDNHDLKFKALDRLCRLKSDAALEGIKKGSQDADETVRQQADYCLSLCQKAFPPSTSPSPNTQPATYLRIAPASD